MGQGVQFTLVPPNRKKEKHVQRYSLHSTFLRTESICLIFYKPQHISSGLVCHSGAAYG